MTIVAYASALPNPSGGQSDKTVDLAETPLPVAEVQVYGAGVDTDDAEAQISYDWTILRQPDGPPAAWKDNASAVANPVLASLQTWGNYRLFLVVTNQNTGLSSEANPLKAPNSAFVHVRMSSVRKSLEKPAPGERNHWMQLHKLADILENLESATDPDPTILTTGVDGTWTPEGYRPGVIVTPGYAPPAFTGDTDQLVMGTALHYFHVHQTLRLYNWNVVLQDGGDVAPGTAYRFRLKTGTADDLRAETMIATVSLDLTGAPLVARGPLVLTKTLGDGTYLEIPAGSFIGVYCVACPQESAGDRIGGGMSVTLFTKRVAS